MAAELFVASFADDAAAAATVSSRRTHKESPPMDKIVHVIMWLFVGALVVLIVTHAAGFATAVNAVGGQVTNDAALLAGYQPAVSKAAGTATVNPGGMK